MSCNANIIPAPPTTLASCSVPIGGSNSSILDTCCNSHINAIATYGAPGSNSNAPSDNGCFQFCVTDTAGYVENCLMNALSDFEEGEPIFQCFNTETTSSEARSDYGNSGAKAHGRALSWTATALVGLALFGSAFGAQ